MSQQENAVEVTFKQIGRDTSVHIGNSYIGTMKETSTDDNMLNLYREELGRMLTSAYLRGQLDTANKVKGALLIGE